MMELNNTVAASSRAASCDLADEVVILDLNSGVYFGLKGVGSGIWRAIQQPTPVHQVVERLLAEYDIPRETCEAQTLDFLEDLAKRGLVAVDRYVAA